MGQAGGSGGSGGGGRGLWVEGITRGLCRGRWYSWGWVHCVGQVRPGVTRRLFRCRLCGWRWVHGVGQMGQEQKTMAAGGSRAVESKIFRGIQYIGGHESEHLNRE